MNWLYGTAKASRAHLCATLGPSGDDELDEEVYASTLKETVPNSRGRVWLIPVGKPDPAL